MNDYIQINYRIKLVVFILGWLKAKNVMFAFGTHGWWSSPLACLGID